MKGVSEQGAHKKVKLSTTISPYQKRRLDELIEIGEFDSAAGFTGNAFGEFFGRYDSKEEIKEMKAEIEDIKEMVSYLTKIIKELKK